MKKAILLPVLFLFVLPFTFAQKNITLEDIWSKGTFSQERLEALRSLKNGEEYSVLKVDREQHSVRVDAFSYETGEKTRTLIDAKAIPGLPYFRTYDFNADESAALLSTELESIYRRSTQGVYYVYSLEDQSLVKVSPHKIKEPTFSPDGKKVAFSYENNLYIRDLDQEEPLQITKDGKVNAIINGTTDWVYEEEFAFTRAYAWNKDGTKIGFLRFDESQVPEITMEYYGTSPQRDLYPYPYTYKYPKAGENNSKVSLWIYDLKTAQLQQIDLGRTYEYLPRIKWTEDPDILSVQAMNRHQDELDLLFVQATDYTAKVVLHEEDSAYIDITDNLTFLADNSFIWTSEKDNWNHIYYYDHTGALIRQVTHGDWDVTLFYGYDQQKDRLFYQSTENGSINRDVYSISLQGKQKKRLTPNTGTNEADFSQNFVYFINTFNDVRTPNVYTLHKASNGKLVRTIEDNRALREQLKDYDLSGKELSTLDINGNTLNMWMIKPKDFDPDKKYPLFLFQYSGPGSQQVSNSFYAANDFWYEMLASQGYIVACVDGRGTGFKGADFKKSTQLQLGKYEVQDQIAVAQKLGKESFIDADRIGIWGWSYGGFMASNALFQGADTFKMAIAVAPVTSWRFYDSIYTERYMNTPQENLRAMIKTHPSRMWIS